MNYLIKNDPGEGWAMLGLACCTGRGFAGYGMNLHCVLEVPKSWEQARAGSGQQGVSTLVAGAGQTPREERLLFKRSFLACVTHVNHTHLTDLMASSVTCDGCLPF